jgi:hypothetical protein
MSEHEAQIVQFKRMIESLEQDRDRWKASAEKSANALSEIKERLRAALELSE